jgi:hypothetical protein
MYSIIRFRAGLVALAFVLITSISLVSSVPIPAPQSGLSSSTLFSRSNPTQDANDHMQLDNRKILSKGQLSGAPAAMRALTRNPDLIDTDDAQLVRRTNIFKKIGNAIKSAADKVGAGIKKAADTVGAGIKTAAKDVEHFAQTTGAKIVKFGTKVVQTVGEVVAKAASFIPDVGKPLEKAIDGVSKVAGVISDHIHANLSAKLQKGMNVMNTANKVMSYFRRDEEGFQQRDISDAYYFEELE